MERPCRKPHRLQSFDYSTPGAYFITICTKDRKCIFWETVGASIARPQTPSLSPWGKIADTAIQHISSHYPAVSVDHYAVMPNHIHLLLQIHSDPDGRAMPAPTISIVVQQLKGIITKQICQSVWQKLFYDHVIRDQRDYDEIWKYIDGNPSKWEEDCFYSQ